MRHIFLRLLTVLSPILAAIAAPPAPVPELPASADLQAWYATVKVIGKGLESGEPRFDFVMKKAHAYAKVTANGEVVGAFRSEASSTCVEGEIATFNIARALGCSDCFQPATGIILRGKGLVTFGHLMRTAHLPAIKEDDRAMVLAEIASDPKMLSGVFKRALPLKAVNYYSIERADAPPNGVLNEADPIARFLKHHAPQPGMELLTPPGIKAQAPARTLARQLSNILLVDALAGQWDRFSGGNLHMLVEDGRARCIAVDNGGASFDDDQGNLGRFMKTVSRFDPKVTARLFALEKFLTKGGHFLGFHDGHTLAQALKIEEPEHWEVFRKRVRQVAAHIRVSRDGAFFEE